MKQLLVLLSILCLPSAIAAECMSPSGQKQLMVSYVAKNAVRVRYGIPNASSQLPDWIYVRHDEEKHPDISAEVKDNTVTVKDATGHVVFRASHHQLESGVATLSFDTSDDDCQYGLGQFQDGYSNVRGLSRRLTQVNTQISIPMLLSSKGYGVLWNNYGMTEFNPCDESVQLVKRQGAGAREVVNVTSTEGGKKEVRERHIFDADIQIEETGDYALLLNVGQKMARRHHLTIDGKTVIDMQNLWLPPTASKIVRLTKGRHRLSAELTKDDVPVLYFSQVKDQTVFRSPVSEAVDYTVFVGSPDEIIASYRSLTGECPQMPSWALGYIHCRERFHSSDEILQTANRFRSEQLPVSMLVQDWQYWGKYGWNSMRFDEEFYPDPKALTDSLHRMDIRLMLSVWSKIDKNSDVGRQMEAHQYYIPGTDWIDFFNPDAAAAYWKNFSERLLPLGIDAWWQDATEPENDDLVGRRVNNGRWSGEQVRNVYPLLVNKTVYEGLMKAGKTPMILTRCGFPGIQRYGSALWSGDVGNDWETFRRQITAGLGVQAAGVPWWTYDAGGFFRPQNQYTDPAYIERMLRWIQTSVYLPLMRVHGYMSNTEPWNYGPEAQRIIADCLKERYRLLPYIERCAQEVAQHGGTLMRPLVFDFAHDPEALHQQYQYMFGPALLISPVTQPGVTRWRTYLPQQPGGWYDYRTGQHYEGGQYVTTPVTKAHIPVFVRAGYQQLCPSATTQAARSRIVEDGGTGPYKAVMTEVATLPEHTVFQPQDLSAFDAQHPLPVMVWGNGACANSPWEHMNFLNEIASHGFIVLATGNIPMTDEWYKGPMSRSEQQIESIDWAIAQNADPQSPYYQKLDVSNICVAGMSCGGLQTLFNCADPRIKTIMICNSGLFNEQNAHQAVGGMPMPKKEKLNDLHSPVIYILGGKEDIAYENGMDDFHRIQHVPAFAANFPVGHGGTYRQPHGGEFTVVALAWLQWQLKGDKQAAKFFVGKKCGLSQRKDWTVERNKLFK